MIKNYFIFNNIIIIISFFYKGRLGGDDLQSFNFAFNLIEESEYNLFSFIREDGNIWQFSHRKIWILQNIIIIYLLKFFNFFVNFDLKIISSYFCGYIITFYTIASFFCFINYY